MATSGEGQATAAASVAGGKFRRMPFRRARQATPYDRPHSSTRGTNNRNGESNNSSGLFTKLVVDPASKLINYGAQRFFASVFRKRLPPAPPQPAQPPGIRMGRNYRRMTFYRRTRDALELNGGRKAKNNETKNASSCENAQPRISLDSLKSASEIPSLAWSREPRPGVIFVFEKASLVLAKIKNSYQIVNPDEHTGFMKKHNLNRSDYRPDIIHEVLSRLLGSRLNLCGGIQAVYVKTTQGYLIKVEPNLCVPRTLKGFCAMMSQLFQNLSIKGSGRCRRRKLLQMIQNPVALHLPVGSLKIGLSSTSSKAVNLQMYFDSFGHDRPLVFVIGAMAHGKIDNEYTDDFVAVSRIPLSASLCVRRICNALERQMEIL